jgi:hypothetical protein
MFFQGWGAAKDRWTILVAAIIDVLVTTAVGSMWIKVVAVGLSKSTFTLQNEMAFNRKFKRPLKWVYFQSYPVTRCLCGQWLCNSWILCTLNRHDNFLAHTHTYMAVVCYPLFPIHQCTSSPYIVGCMWGAGLCCPLDICLIFLVFTLWTLQKLSVSLSLLYSGHRRSICR